MEIKLFKSLLIVLVFPVLALLYTPLNFSENQVSASEIPDEIFFKPLSMPGRIEGTGNYFEIKDSQYLNITLKSSEEIKVVIESIPRMISLDIEAGKEGVNITELTIEGLEPSKTYYKYQDSYKNKAVFVSGNQGDYAWTQDLSQSHHIWLQEIKGTTFIDKDTILDHDITGSVEITTDNITLDCNGYSITGPGGYGIILSETHNVAIKNCTITNFSYGIELYHNSFEFSSSSNNNILSNNAIFGNYSGIYLDYSNNNTLTNNTDSSNVEGILLIFSSGNTLTGNSMAENQYNFGVYDPCFPNYIDTSNTVDGKPILYILNATDKVYDSSTNAGTFHCIGCNNITVKDLNLNKNHSGIRFCKTQNSKIENIVASYNVRGIYLDFSDKNTITSNTVSNNGTGILLDASNENTVIDNSISNNGGNGGVVSFWLGNNNTIIKNNIFNNSIGITLVEVYDNIVSENNVVNNGVGIYLSSLTPSAHLNDKIYHNNFIKNNIQVFNFSDSVSPPFAFFDDGYPSGGNYWSDYIGVDEKSGPDQDQPGSDGIGDTPYVINEYYKDRYPFMKENGWGEPTEPEKWSFALITDLHIGKDDPDNDYNGPTWDDLSSESYTSIDNITSREYLRQIVDIINAKRELYNIDFVVVTGDIADSAELSEFKEAIEILNQLEIPWVPVIGNHDVWPFYGANPDWTDPYAEMAPEVGPGNDGTDRFFNEMFNSQYEKLSETFQNWEKTNISVWNPETNPEHNSYFQNFTFDYDNYHFIGLDFNDRDNMPWPFKGVMPEGDLYNFSGGTWNWLTKHLEEYLNTHPESNENIILFAHHPFRNLPKFGFSGDELDKIQSFLINYADNVFAEFAGHTHPKQLKDHWLLSGNLSRIMRVIETPTNSNSPFALVVQVYPEGKIDYSEILGYELIITAKSPVDLVITDPDNLTIGKELNEIPGATYMEMDIDGDGSLDDWVGISERKLGNYQIKTTPEPGATPADTYTIEASTLEDSFGYAPVILAENVPISGIPTVPYIFEVKEKENTQLVYNGDSSGQYSDLINLSAILTDGDGNPLANKKIVFEIGEQSISAITNESEIATISAILNQIPGEYYFIDTIFLGDEDYLPSFDSKPLEILKEGTVINVSNKEGFTFDEVTLEAQILDDDGETLLDGPYEVEFKVNDKVIGKAKVDENSNAKIDWNVDFIPKELIKIYPIIVTFAENEYYFSAQDEGEFTLKSAKWLKQDAISELESTKTGDKKNEQKIDGIIKYIQNSLDSNLWIDASHLVFFQKDCFDPKMIEINFDGLDFEKLFELEPDKVEQDIKTTFKGKCLGKKLGIMVFHNEYIATKLMLNELQEKSKTSKELKNVFKEVIVKLVKADQLLAKIAISDAKNIPIKNLKFQKIVEKQIKKAEEELLKAEKELAKNKSDKVIMRLSKSWLHAQLAIKFATLIETKP